MSAVKKRLSLTFGRKKSRDHSYTGIVDEGIITTSEAPGGFTKDEEQDGDVYPVDGPLPNVTMRSKTARHLRVR
jgi:hypothetical protein